MSDDELVASLAAALSSVETYDPEVQTALDNINARLTDPLRIVVAGRVSSGKSTLINALLGHRVAPTDVSECTKVVTWYRYGYPERVRLNLIDGTSRDVGFDVDGRLPKELGVPLSQVRDLTVTLANGALQHFLLVDTPGFSSGQAGGAETEQAEHRMMDARSREAAADCDAMVFVLNQNLKADELEVLQAFQQAQSLPASAVNAVGALTKIDRLSSPGEEPLDVGARLAKRYAERHSAEVANIVPVCGLMAETGEAGLLTEKDADNLARLQQQLDSDELGLLLTSADRFITAQAGVSADDRRRLLDRLDLYGLQRTLALVRDGSASAGALRRELTLISGIESLRAQLMSGFAERGMLLRLLWALEAIWNLSYRSGIEAGSGQKLRDAVEIVRLDPRMHEVKVLAALQKICSGEVSLPLELEEEVRRFALNPDPVLRLQAPADSPDARRQAAQAGVARWRSFRMNAGPFEDEIARVMLRSYQLAATR